jgi:uroporphyrin-III C-methyltransferase
MPDERIVTGTINSISSIVKEEKIGAPAIIVIGEVVRLHPSYVAELVSRKASSREEQL